MWRILSMNDFTKKELEYFLMIMKPFHWLWRNDPLKLEAKIQSMIDNYCDHEPNIMSQDERARKFKIYKEEILQKYGNDPDKVPPHLEPDFNEGWK
jgi:hypothetical protein